MVLRKDDFCLVYNFTNRNETEKLPQLERVSLEIHCTVLFKLLIKLTTYVNFEWGIVISLKNGIHYIGNTAFALLETRHA